MHLHGEHFLSSSCCLVKSNVELLCSQASSGCNESLDFLSRCPNSMAANVRQNPCGLYQLSPRYWTEAGRPGNDFGACATSKACAEKAVRAFMRKHATDCDGDKVITCADFAAIHFLGPNASCKSSRNARARLHASRFWSDFRATKCYEGKVNATSTSTASTSRRRYHHLPSSRRRVVSSIIPRREWMTKGQRDIAQRPEEDDVQRRVRPLPPRPLSPKDIGFGRDDGQQKVDDHPGQTVINQVPETITPGRRVPPIVGQDEQQQETQIHEQQEKGERSIGNPQPRVLFASRETMRRNVGRICAKSQSLSLVESHLSALNRTQVDAMRKSVCHCFKHGRRLVNCLQSDV